VGGIGTPDGLLDAPLGPLAYRAIVECKTVHADTTVNSARLEEPARFRESYHAQYALLVGRVEVETAIADLVRTGAATKLPDRDGIVLCRPPRDHMA
jgi:hypothetical protein